MSQSRVSQAGFTLMEMILVALIVSGLLAMYIRYTAQQVETARIARVVTQIQQIENAGLAYYMDNNNWGTTTTGEALTASSNYVQYNYLSGQSGVVPATPWGGSYTIKVNATGGLQLSLTVPDPNTAQLLATRLPIASASGTTVTTQINVPAQVLNKAKSLTSAAIYNHGACVPAPVCPKGMSPQIIVLPTGITGYYGSGSSTPSCTDKSNPATCGTLQAYPLTGYTVSAVGDSSGSPVDVGAGTLNSCDGSTPASSSCYYENNSTASTPITAGKFWRVCMQVATSGGTYQPQFLAWAQMTGSILAVTRCVVTNESTGSGFNVFQ